MASSTSNLDLIIQSQASKEVTANALFDAASPATTYGRRQSTCSGLTWGYYGGIIYNVSGTTNSIANGTLTLTASTTNYIVASKTDGAVSFSTATTNWNDVDNYWELYSVVTGTATVTSWSDYRVIGLYSGLYAQGDWRALSIIAKTADYTPVLSEKYAYFRMNSGSALNFTVPPSATTAFPVGTQLNIRQVGGGQVTIVAGSGVTINTPETLKLRKAGSTVSLFKVGSDEWDAMGDLEAL